jgi:hypothetical protein
MNRLLTALILLANTGCKAQVSPNPGMVYGFANVSLNYAKPHHPRLSNIQTNYLDPTLG